jgi:molecular chaperone DnaK (HSP70)
MNTARYIIGIDLGTTNSAVTYIDTHEHDIILHSLLIPQNISANEISKFKTLPSFVYFPIKNSDEGEELSDKPLVGVYSREQSLLQPDRVIASSKSWLCHNKVDRRSGILPWHGAEDIEPITPVEASSLLLQHMKNSWNQQFTKDDFSNQQIIITVPASFDETARALTAEAIEMAGIKNVALLEEPQSAFYAWLYHHEDKWKTLLNEHQQVLVCDIGGGTSDFSLIGINRENQDLNFQRIAVGEHLLLGGDNLDIALAYFLEPHFSQSKTLSPKDWGKLISQCRNAKENLFQKDGPKFWPITLASSGKSLIANTLKKDLSKEDAAKLFLDGFLPLCDFDDAPISQQTGFQEFGLPYASDSAMSKHLAAFLKKSLLPNQIPTAVLFNGGFFEAPLFKERIKQILNQWFKKDIVELKADALDLAVSQGAAYYGLARRGRIKKIEGGLPRATFIGLLDKNGQQKALCLAPLGMEESTVIKINEFTFHLRVNMPVEFPIYSTKGMAHIKPGDLIDTTNLTSGVPIRSFLKTGKKNKSKAKDIEVFLQCQFSALGTLEIFCHEVNGDRQWKLEFDTKHYDSQNIETIGSEIKTPLMLFNEEIIKKIEEEINLVFSDSKNNPESLMKKIETITGKNRWTWDLVFLRQLWAFLIDKKDGRKLSPAHEERWLNFTGFCLRPGYGVEMDDWRVLQTWNVFMDGITFENNSQSTSEWFLFWNRIAGGLNGFQQRELASQYIAAIKAQVNIQTNNSLNTNLGKAKKLQLGPGEKSQFYRLMGNLEDLPLKDKKEIIHYILRQIKKFGIQDANYTGIWSLGRIATRSPLYGALNNVIAIRYVKQILQELQTFDNYRQQDLFAIASMGRKTGDRYRDLDNEDRTNLAEWLKNQKATDEHISLILEGSDFNEDDRNLIFGEKLPTGLRIK